MSPFYLTLTIFLESIYVKLDNAYEITISIERFDMVNIHIFILSSLFNLMDQFVNFDDSDIYNVGLQICTMCSKEYSLVSHMTWSHYSQALGPNVYHIKSLRVKSQLFNHFNYCYKYSTILLPIITITVSTSTSSTPSTSVLSISSGRPQGKTQSSLWQLIAILSHPII